MRVTIFKPNPDKDRWNYWVVFFPDLEKGLPQPHYVDTSIEAENLAADLAETHGCDWEYMPDLPELPHWFDENGDLRNIDRVELTDLGHGRGQFNLFSGNMRLSAESGTIDYLLDTLLWIAEDWCEE